MVIPKADLLRIAELDSLDSISMRAFSNEIYLHKGRNIGMYVIGRGVVLQPIYDVIQRFDTLLKVGTQTDHVILFGCYCINEETFLIDPVLSENEFWIQFKLLKQKSSA